MRDKYLDAGVLTYGSSKELEFKVAINKVTRAIQDASITGIGGISKEIGAIDWGNIFGKLVDTGASLVQANNPPSGGGYYQQQYQQPVAQSTGISTNTLLLFGAGGLVLYFILRKK